MLDEHEEAERRHASGWNASAWMITTTSSSTNGTAVHAQAEDAGIGARKRALGATVPMLLLPA